MKKLFKKSIACLIAVLMVVSSMPFTALTANAAETKIDISVWDATSVTTETSNSATPFTFTDTNSSITLQGIHWGTASKTSGSGNGNDYFTFDNATVSTQNNISNINGDSWSFSAKFAYSGISNTATLATVFGIGTSTPRTYTNTKNNESTRCVADLVDIRDNGKVYLSLGSDTPNADITLTTEQRNLLFSTSAADYKVLTVRYKSGYVTIDVNGTVIVPSTAVDPTLFSSGVSNYFVGSNVRCTEGGNAPYYKKTNVSNSSTNATGDFIYNMYLYSLSGAKYEETGSNNSAAVQLKAAMTAFENKFDGTKVYSNIEPAYTAYVEANTALNNACKTGSDAGLLTAKTNLENATKAMTAWTAYTGTKHGSFANDNNNNSEAEYARTYTNVLWANSSISTVHSTGGDTVAKSVGLAGSRSDYVAQVKFYYDETTLLFDGTNTAQFPVMMSVHGKKKPWNWNWDNLRIHFAMISSNGMQFKENWRGTDSQLNCQRILLTKDKTNVQIIESTSSNFNGAKDKYFANELQLKEDLSNNPNITIEYKPTIKYNVGYDERNLTVEYTPSATIRVLNYKKVVTAINDNKSKLNNVANYKQGGLSTLVAAFDKATKNPNSFFTSSNDYSTCQTNYQNALNNITASPKEDSAQTIQHSNASYNWTVTKEATCSEAGLKDGVCKFCGEEVKNVKISATGHNLTKTAAKNATCTEAGNSAYWTCSNCQKMFSDADATMEITEIPTISATGHNLTKTPAKNATCTEAGNSAYWTCSTCQKMFSDAEATMEITDIPTISASGHNLTETAAKNATCTEAGNSAYWTCSDCGKMFSDANAATEITKIPTIPATGHHLTETAAKDATCTEAGNSAYWTCSDCGKMFSDAEATIEITEIPTIPAKGHSYKYTYNNDGTHTKACENGDESTSEPCSNELMQKNETYDTWHCTVCRHEYNRDVTDMSALKENITVLEAAINVDDAAYKYKASALATAKETLDEAKAYVANDDNRYASIQDVNAMSINVGTAYTELTENGLAKYSQTFIIRKDDGKGNTTDLEKFTAGYENLAYGSTVEFNDYTIPTINDGSTLTGLPMYAVYKWVKTVNGVEQKLAATDVQISDVVKGETTYICYVLDFKATDETQKTTRVRYLDKTGNTIEFDTAEVGSTYVPKDSVKYPNLPYYVFDYWECVFGTPENVGTREIVFKARYKYDETTLANKCTIQGFGNVKVNGESSCSATYDSKVTLTGATKYAFCDENQNIISYINNDYIYTPHVNNEIVYIIGVEEEAKKATTAITGSFVQKNAGKLSDGITDYHNLYVNAQYYLPEGTKAVEAGIVISKSKNTEDDLQIGKTGVTKLISETQSPNHEYSMAMSFVNSGKINVRSYLICVDGSGNTYTVYSAVKTIEYRA